MGVEVHINAVEQGEEILLFRLVTGYPHISVRKNPVIRNYRVSRLRNWIICSRV